MSIELLSINSCLSIKMKTHFDDIAEVVQWLACSLLFRRFGGLAVRLSEGAKLFFTFFSLSGVFLVITLKK